MLLQVRDIGSGNFGVAKLMKDKKTGQMVAVKFIERGDKVGEYGLLIFELMKMRRYAALTKMLSNSSRYLYIHTIPLFCVLRIFVI